MNIFKRLWSVIQPQSERKSNLTNSIYAIKPYKWNGIWVFDDPSVGLVKEAFVAGADKVIDKITAHIPDADTGHILLFSAESFPTHQFKFDWVRPGEYSGNWYYSPTHNMEGWLCPALFKYFETRPDSIYVEVRPLEKPERPKIQIIREGSYFGY